MKKKMTLKAAKETIDHQAELITNMGFAFTSMKKDYLTFADYKDRKLKEKKLEVEDLSNKLNLARVQLTACQASLREAKRVIKYYQTESAGSMLHRLYLGARYSAQAFLINLKYKLGVVKPLRPNHTVTFLDDKEKDQTTDVGSTQN